MKRKAIVKIGDSFGSWEVIGESTRDKHGHQRCLCKCSCGKEAHLVEYTLWKGTSKGCASCVNAVNATIHGKQSHPLYWVWSGMKNRCNNKKSESYKYYGAKGIKVCDRGEKSIHNFIEDMGERPEGTSLDRIDNNGSYEPSNCKWSTRTEQGRNKSSTKLSIEKVKEIRKLLAQGLSTKYIAEIYNVSYSAVYNVKTLKTWKDVL